MNRHNLEKLLLAALTGWCFFMLMRATGPMQDDFWYQRQYINRFDGDKEANYWNFRFIGEDYITTWGQALESCKNHYLYHDNARMANDIRLMANMVPEWVTDLLSALMLVVLTAGIIKLASRRISLSPMAWGGTLLLIFIYPTWEHAMLCTDFLMNYLWAMALLTAAALTVIAGPRGWRLAAGTAFCFFAGTMHEGLTVPIVCGLVCGLIQHRKNASPRQWLLTAAMAAGAALIVFSPALLDRLHDDVVVRGQEFSVPRALAKGIILDWPALLLTTATVFLHAVRQGRRPTATLLRDSLPLLATAAVSYLITGFTLSAERALWPADIALAILTVRAISRSHRNSAILRPAGWALTLTVSGWLGMVATWQAMSTRNQQALIELAAGTTEKILYFDLIDANSYPFIALDMITGAGIDVNELKSALGSVRGLEDGDKHVVLPERFRGMPLDSLPLVPGDARLRGTYPFFYSENGKLNSHDSSIYVDYGAPYSLDGCSPFSFCFISQWMKYIRSMVSGIDPRLTEVQETPVAVTAEMRNRGISDRDTVWFYLFQKIPRHNLSRKINAINLK